MTDPLHRNAPHRPVFHPGYLRRLCALIDNEGGNAAQVLALAGLEPAQLCDDAPRLSLAATRWLILAAQRAAGRPTLALQAGAGMPLSAHGELGQALAVCPDLRHAVALLAQHHAARSGVARVALHPLRGGLAYVVTPTLDLGDVRRFVLEHITASAASMFSRISGGLLHGATLRLPWARPSWHSLYARLSPQVHYDAEELAWHLPDSLLDRPNPTADVAACASAACALDRLAATPSEAHLVVQLRHWLCVDAPPGPDLAVAAARLGLSTRTVIRRLGAAGLSYRALQDEVQRRRASELLQQTALPLADVAQRLGLNSPSNLARLCRRWFGATPLALRRAAARADAADAPSFNG